MGKPCRDTGPLPLLEAEDEEAELSRLPLVDWRRISFGISFLQMWQKRPVESRREMLMARSKHSEQREWPHSGRMRGRRVSGFFPLQ